MAWKNAWAYLPIDYGETIGILENITQHMTFKNNLNGERLRVKFTNCYSNQALVFEHATIRLQGAQPVDLRVNNSSRIEIPAGCELYSDDCALAVKAGQEIIISLYSKQTTPVYSVAATWAAQGWHCVVAHGDTTQSDKCEGESSRMLYEFFMQDVHAATAVCGISEVQIFTQESVKTIALFGDSITHMSYYCDPLKDKLYSLYPGQVTVTNAGIGGNRLCFDATYAPGLPGNGSLFGKAGKNRFEKDVFGSTHPDAVIVLIGINDLVHAVAFDIAEQIVCSEDLIANYRELINTAHMRGTKIYLCTIMPFLHACNQFPTEEVERSRLLCNEWICTQRESDGVYDFSAAVDDEKALGHMQENTHLGDGIHPNLTGGVKMVGAIDIKKLMEEINTNKGIY